MMDVVSKETAKPFMAAKAEETNMGAFVTTTDIEDSREVTIQPGGCRLAAKPLTQPLLLQWLYTFYDIFMCIIPLLLIVKTILILISFHIISKRGYEDSDALDNIVVSIRSFNHQLVTLFTIVFVMIVSTTVRRIALWRAQKGATIAELEQWQASTSLTSTVKIICVLRMFTINSAALIFLWSWYYLGSQSVEREYFLQLSASDIDFNALSISSQAPSALDDDFYSTMKSSKKAVYNAQFVVASAPAKILAYDSSGSMLLPNIRNMECSPNSYCDVAAEMSPASFAGLPIYPDGLDGISGNVYWSDLLAQFTLNTSYLSTVCESSVVRNVSDFPAGTISTIATSLNLTKIDETVLGSNSTMSNRAASFEVWYRTNDSDYSVQAISSTCTINTVSLSIKGNCTVQGCQAVQALDLSHFYGDTVKRTVFDNPSYGNRFFEGMLLSSGVPTDRDDATVIDKLYMNHQLWLLNQTLNIQEYADANDITVEQALDNRDFALVGWADQLSFITTAWINTYQTIFQRARIEMTIADNITWNSENYTDSFSATTLRGNYYNPSYIISIPWIIVDFISCAVLLLAAIASFYLRVKTIAPDILGYVSSLTRDNPNITLPEMGSTLDGLSRTRLLKQVKVQIANVKTAGDIGRVGLVQSGPKGHVQATNLRKDQRYI